MPFITTFLHSQLLVTLPYPTNPFTNQTIIVTGGNSGLGLEAARHFIRLDAAKVILAVRTTSKGAAAAADISASTNTPASRIEVWPLDLASHDSIRAFAAKVQRMERLDAVVMNAGILTGKYELVGGEESTIAINVVNTTLLGLMLLPKLRESAKRIGATGRLVFIGSDLQMVAKFTEQNVPGKSIFEALTDKKTANMADRYNTSKLLLLYAVRSIAALSPVSPESNIIINYVTPGACKSDIFRDEASWISRVAMGIAVALVARTTEAGSRTYLDAARQDVSEETHGKFLMDCKIWPNGENVDSAHGQELQGIFVKELFAKLEGIQPGVTNI
ncbi:MAG: hypothetical protein Q9187_007090 [Circinaria calcarea]